MPSETPQIHVRFTPEFKRNPRVLSKKYRHIHSDVQPVIEQLQEGRLVGDRISGSQHVVFKMRVENSDIQRGKSAGYRLIYQVKNPALVILITIYSKLDQADISADEIRRILSEFEQGGK